MGARMLLPADEVPAGGAPCPRARPRHALVREFRRPAGGLRTAL